MIPAFLDSAVTLQASRGTMEILDQWFQACTTHSPGQLHALEPRTRHQHFSFCCFKQKLLTLPFHQLEILVVPVGCRSRVLQCWGRQFTLCALFFVPLSSAVAMGQAFVGFSAGHGRHDYAHER